MSQTIPFTQYLRPDGRQREVLIDRTPEIAEQAAKVRAAGFHFDIEELMSGHVSMTVEPNAPDTDGEDGPIAQEICMNGPDVPLMVDRLIAAAYGRVVGHE